MLIISVFDKDIEKTLHDLHEMLDSGDHTYVNVA